MIAIPTVVFVRHQIVRLPCRLRRIYGEFYEKLDSPDAEDEDDRLQELWGLGEQFIQSALQLCQSKDLQNIWERQDHSFLETEPSHKLQLWVVPAVDEQCDEAVQEGRRYNVVPPDRMHSFVSGLQTNATACCPQGVTAQVMFVKLAFSSISKCNGLMLCQSTLRGSITNLQFVRICQYGCRFVRICRKGIQNCGKSVTNQMAFPVIGD